MSRIFYDHLIVIDEVEKEINAISTSCEEKEELWNIVDEIIHHKVVGCVLDKLPPKDHGEFMNRFLDKPHEEELWGYLKEKIGENIEEIIKQELGDLAYEILKELKP